MAPVDARRSFAPSIRAAGLGTLSAGCDADLGITAAALALAASGCSWIERASVDASGNAGNDASAAPALSRDGRYVAFESIAWNLVGGDSDATGDVLVHDRSTGLTQRASDNSTSVPRNSDLSGSGRFVVWEFGALDPGTFSFPSVATYDPDTGMATSFGGFSPTLTGAGAPSISDDGHYIAFETYEPGGGPTGFVIPRVAVRDRETSAISKFGLGGDVAIAGDGRFVAYDTSFAFFDDDPSQVFRVNRVSQVVITVSVEPAGADGNGKSFDAAISDDGHLVAFTSAATNLVGDDGHPGEDVFVRDLPAAGTALVSRNTFGAAANGPSREAALREPGGTSRSRRRPRTWPARTTIPSRTCSFAPSPSRSS